ncbi:hypothetical protein MHYP_G00280950 [Metynnis hypsauchen]
MPSRHRHLRMCVMCHLPLVTNRGSKPINKNALLEPLNSCKSCHQKRIKWPSANSQAAWAQFDTDQLQAKSHCFSRSGVQGTPDKIWSTPAPYKSIHG